MSSPLLKSVIPSPWLHYSLLSAAAYIAPLFLEMEKKDVVLRVDPLLSLHALFKRTLSGKGDERTLNKILHAIPATTKQQIAFEIFWASAQGKNICDPKELMAIIEKVAYTRLNRIERTLRKEISVYSNLEKTALQPSCVFDLGRKEIEGGQIGFHNGIACPLDYAKWNAEQISDKVAQGYNLHCTYSATLNLRSDLTSAVLGQCGILTPPVEKLLERWRNFFSKEGSSRLLQLCHSRGAIEVDNALNQLPPELQQRIIVITLAPACLIPSDKAYRVVNLLIPDDLVVQIASNRHLMDCPHILKLSPHADHPDPHYPHGASFREPLSKMVDCYIRTNDIVEQDSSSSTI